MEDEDNAKEIGRRLVYFAAERTLMAWIRTALGLMALGFVIDRFGLVLRMTLPEAGPRLHPKAFSLGAGAALVLLGAAMSLTAAVRYWRFARAYHREGETLPRHGILVGVIYSALVALLGAVIAGFLFVAAG